jgi:hypothetical protein
MNLFLLAYRRLQSDPYQIPTLLWVVVASVPVTSEKSGGKPIAFGDGSPLYHH